MNKLRFYLTFWMAKATHLVMRLLKHNATFFPGKLALKFCPDFLAYIGKPRQVIAVTGTNGKTTVSNLLVDMLQASGKKVLNNRLGSNVPAGIVTTLLTGAGLSGKSRYDLAVLEVDERSSLRIYPYVKPDYVVVTNLFRDSVNRNAHPQYIAELLSKTIPATSKLILNGDDLISGGICPENQRVYFGIDRMETDGDRCINIINDMQICPVCAGELEYEFYRYHHIGRARCRDCGFHSPKCAYSASEVDLHNMTMRVRDEKLGEEWEYALLGDNIVNIYNMVTVIALFRELGYSHSQIREYLGKIHIVDTRFNIEKAGNVQIVFQMGKDKNALACSRTFDYLTKLPGEKEVILMMNCLGCARTSSELTCWISDCDFEFLNRPDISRIICTGARARDYYLRLLIAGVPEEKLRCEHDEMTTPELLEMHPGESVCIIFGTDSIALAKQVKAKTMLLAKEAAQ